MKKSAAFYRSYRLIRAMGNTPTARRLLAELFREYRAR